MKKIAFILILLCVGGFLTLPINGQTNSSTRTQQLILNKLSNIEARLLVVENNQKMILREMDKRFEQVDKRFEQLDKRFGQVDNRFGDMMNYILILVAVFASMTALTIGFALWDRRTMIRPFESKVKEIENKLDRVQTINSDLISALKEYAQKDARFAEIIKGFKIF